MTVRSTDTATKTTRNATDTDRDRVKRLESDNAELQRRVERLEVVLTAAAGAMGTLARPVALEDDAGHLEDEESR